MSTGILNPSIFKLLKVKIPKAFSECFFSVIQTVDNDDDIFKHVSVSDTKLSIVYITYYVKPIVRQTQIMKMDFNSSIIYLMYGTVIVVKIFNVLIIMRG